MSVQNAVNVEANSAAIVKGDRVALARGITLVESNAPDHFKQAQELIRRLLPHSGKAIRVGITGVPGAGKSTFIEALGIYLIEQGKRVAVLAVDPSSSMSGGSILGDKTRMEALARHPSAFIRPSPSGGELGGVTRKTRESIVLCEAAGYDVILVETMGVGQSETEVRSMVDFFLLLQIAGAGDELQGIKKGVIEMADAIAVNKADGANSAAAARARSEIRMALHYLNSGINNWQPPVLICSALENRGIVEIWQVILDYIAHQKKNGVFLKIRREQEIHWLHQTVNKRLLQLILENPRIAPVIKDCEEQVRQGRQTVTGAAMTLIEKIQREMGI